MIGTMLLERTAHEGRIPVNGMNEFTVWHRNEQPCHKANVNNQQNPHGRRFTKNEQQNP